MWTLFFRASAFFAVCAAITPAFAEKPERTLRSRLLAQQAGNHRGSPPVVTAVAIQPGGPLLATAGDDHWVRIWNRHDAKRVHLLKGHSDWIRGIAFSPHGEVLATAGNGRRILLWNPEDGTLIRELTKTGYAIATIAYQPGGKILAVAGFDSRVRLVDISSGKTVLDFVCSCNDNRAIAFSRDGSLLATGGRDGVLHLWNTIDGRLIRETKAHRGRIRGIAFSPDDELVVSAGEDRTIQVLRTSTAKVLFSLSSKPAKNLSLVFYAPRRIATGGSDNHVRLWDLKTRRMIDQLEGHTGSVAALAFDDGFLASGSFDTTIRLWHLGQDVPESTRNRFINFNNGTPINSKHRLEVFFQELKPLVP